MRSTFASLILVALLHPIRAAEGIAVAVSPPAVDVGAAALKSGGNAVDAAIAVGFAEAVTWPEAGNIGGGGFMLIHRPKDESVFLDFRETAPAAVTADLFAKGVDYQSIRTAGVPGTVRGFELAHKKFGKLPWKELVLPAVKLAEDGFEIDAVLAKRLNSAKGAKNAEFQKLFGKKEGWKAGDKLVQTDLGRTLRSIADKGADAFYTGAIAEKIVAEMKASGGLIAADDLKNYKAETRVPLKGTYRGYDVIGAPPPSSGGTALITALNILEHFELNKNPWASAESLHLTAEAMRRAFSDRAKYLGDPAFAKVPESLISKQHAEELAKSIDLSKATKSATLGPELTSEGGGHQTTHYSIVDADGMAVSTTYTLENSFGCKVVVRGAGFILNNELTDFNHAPGATNESGMIGTKPNLAAPGKRPLSSMTPTILLKDGKLALVTGSPGGRTIINTVLCIVINYVDYGGNIRQAVDAPRIHHQWFPDRVLIEAFLGRDDVIEQLTKRGHTVTKIEIQGDAHSIAADPKTGQLIGAADKRLNGKSVVVER